MGCFVERQLGILLLGVSLLMVFPVAISEGSDKEPLTYHGGRLLTGNLNVGILWYGPIPRLQKKAILSFFRSLSPEAGADANQPQVSSWWNMVESYQTFAKPGGGGGAAPKITVKVINQASDEGYSYGKVLIKDFIKPLLPKATGGDPNALALMVASKGVTVQDMCAGVCAQHGLIENTIFVAVGDPEEECPECAWPFLANNNAKKGTMQKPPSGDVGADVMVKLLAGGLAGAVTNPFGDGFFAKTHGDHLMEATSNCPDVFATTTLPIDHLTGGAYNAVGEKGTKFLLPAVWNPKTSSCWTPLQPLASS